MIIWYSSEFMSWQRLNAVNLHVTDCGVLPPNFCKNRQRFLAVCGGVFEIWQALLACYKMNENEMRTLEGPSLD